MFSATDWAAVELSAVAASAVAAAAAVANKIFSPRAAAMEKSAAAWPVAAAVATGTVTVRDGPESCGAIAQAGRKIARYRYCPFGFPTAFVAAGATGF